MGTDKNDLYDKEPLVTETHIGRFHRGDADDKTSRKESGQPECEPNADPPWIGDGSLLCKCLQCSSDNRCRIVHVLGGMLGRCPRSPLGRASRHYVCTLAASSRC